MTDQQILITRSSMPLYEEYCAEIRDLWDSHWLTNCGVKHRHLEKELQEYLGVRNVSLFVNGHAALECAFQAMGLGDDGRTEVITTPFTFASTTNAIVRCGLTPVFCDIKSDDFTIDPEKIKPLITDKTCAIVPVHVYGNVCDVEAIQGIADEYGLKVIYDAAHAFGVRVNDVGVARFGDASMFSFHATKVFNTIEGGAVCYTDDGLHEKLSQWRNFGISGPEDVEYIGCNAKMNEFCAAMGICNLRHVDEELSKRETVFLRYLENLSDAKGITLPSLQKGTKPNYAYFPIVINPDAFGATRDDVFAALGKCNIGARKYFYPLINDFECYRQRFNEGSTPVARQAAARVLTLPMYADLAFDDVDAICSIILKKS